VVLALWQDERRHGRAGASTSRSAGGAQDVPPQPLTGTRAPRTVLVVVRRRPHPAVDGCPPAAAAVAAVRGRAPAHPRPGTTTAPAQTARNSVHVRDTGRGQRGDLQRRLDCDTVARAVVSGPGKRVFRVREDGYRRQMDDCEWKIGQIRTGNRLTVSVS